jgi:hypothetical protein
MSGNAPIKAEWASNKDKWSILCPKPLVAVTTMRREMPLVFLAECLGDLVRLEPGSFSLDTEETPISTLPQLLHEAMGGHWEKQGYVTLTPNSYRKAPLA